MMVILQVIINRNNSFLRIILKSVEIFVVAFEVFLIELNSQTTSLELFNLCRKVDTFKLRLYQIQTNSILFFYASLVRSHLDNTPNITYTGWIGSKRHYIVGLLR